MVHLGIVGGGNISETHARAVAATEGVELAAIHGQDQTRAASSSQRK